ncbi:coproporphyrinogen III oxidase [Aliivibrio sp. S3MY1]|uniref:coproporphyrinogen III oxidase n=1 Tax=unclassified Aliivibrio TaxID=2645654 RepID=UPI002379BF8B|nr:MULTISPECIES: coproporphyrinogen III oxidase [unclassified Aliivibrio]MDD9197132.1 coproporphyrinogen III oxidase [Aliivibrio sp. S3MY1]MDD9200007.1 coproporphyrinogen III oxidase [Aliivibrio sp. S2MY1]
MRIYAQNAQAKHVLHLLSEVQSYFKTELTKVSDLHSISTEFIPVNWLRDEGVHGGGKRFEALEGGLFNRASINVSQIHYEDLPEKPYDSATALSTIIHPMHPLLPSIHMHFSWTTLKDGSGYWRIMADLNPSHFNKDDKEYFDQTLKVAAKNYYAQGTKLGNDYFAIPALTKRRGVSHFYLEGFNPVEEDGAVFAKQFVTKVIDTYVHILSSHLINLPQATDAQLLQQLDYHTLYLYQVLTLDKGTTAGLLVHNQNDIGTLGSIPSHINRRLLEEWQGISPEPINELVAELINVLPEASPCPITSEIKVKLAQVIRTFYL